MDEKIKVKIMLAEKHYVLEIKKNDEEIVRKAAKMVNNKLNKYRSIFQKADQESLIQMVAMHFSTDNIRMESRNDTTPFTEKIKELTKALDDCLKEK